MIRKYVYGTPFPTEATVKELPTECGALPYFRIDSNGDFCYALEDEDIVYGLGEQVRGMNKRGWRYVSWNFDNPNHHEDAHSLYGSHNFLLIQGKNTFGVFFDYAGEMTFDIGYTEHALLKVHAAEQNLTVFLIEGESAKEIVHEFRQLIGKSYVAPLWAFGYGQSRWGYKNEADIRKVAERYEKADVPLDSIYLDIDYMERYKDFTVDEARFPDLEQLTKDMQAKGIHLVPIIDAGVKIEDGYGVYEEGKEKNYFCKTKEGKDFIGAVWPGKVHFPDFLQPEARTWFGKNYEVLTKLGIDGFWNDMNEPAIFYTEKNLSETLSEIQSLDNGNMGIEEYFRFTGMVAGLNGNRQSYDEFYHQVDGTLVPHSEVHNLYGMNMTRSAYEALQELEPEKRTLFFSRSSYIGAHRYGGIWQGDNKSWWSHILLSMQQLPALNMAGFLFTGSDTGGFGCDTTEDLVLRWLQYSMFTPLLRNHAADGTREQELYQFGNLSSCKKMIEIRYCLIPYLYSEYLKAALEDTMLFRPLAFDFPEDEMAKQVEDQLLLGNELMIAPIYKQNATGRYVYLPEEMLLVRMDAYDHIQTQVLPKGHHYVPVALEELVFFIRKDKAIPFGKPAKATAFLKTDDLTKLGYADAKYTLYQDDGVSSDLQKSLKVVVVG
jgi:alpha-glucosidase